MLPAVLGVNVIYIVIACGVDRCDPDAYWHGRRTKEYDVFTIVLELCSDQACSALEAGMRHMPLIQGQVGTMRIEWLSYDGVYGSDHHLTDDTGTDS